MTKKVALIIPAYNEETSIASLVCEILSVVIVNGFSIDPVLVNDMSTDIGAGSKVSKY